MTPEEELLLRASPSSQVLATSDPSQASLFNSGNAGPAGVQSGVFASSQPERAPGIGGRIQEAKQFLQNMRPENSQALMVAGLSLLRGDDVGTAGLNALSSRNALVEQARANQFRNEQLNISKRNATVAERNATTAENNANRPRQEQSDAFERQLVGLVERGVISQTEADKLRLERSRNQAANRSVVEDGKPISPSGEGELRALDREYESSIADVEKMLSAIEEDPTLAGSMLSIRKGLQTATGTVEDAASALPESVKEFFGSVASSIADSLGRGELSPEEADAMFNDEKVSQARLFENQLAFVIARTRQPRGKLLASTIQLAREDAKLSGLTSSKDVINKLREVKRILARERSGIQSDLEVLAPPRSRPSEQVQNWKWTGDGWSPEG